MSTFFHVWRTLTLIAALAFLTACGNIPPEERPMPTELEIAKLAEGIVALGPDVDPEEALRAARISFEHTRELAIQYEIVDPPLVHNTKVNMGLKPRGLCWHWAEDMEKRLKAENFETLVIHRAIANANNYRIEHSTAIISQRGDDMYEGMVVDPWRTGGTLTFNKTVLDPDYDWLPQDVVHEQKRQEIRAEQRRARSGF